MRKATETVNRNKALRGAETSIRWIAGPVLFDSKPAKFVCGADEIETGRRRGLLSYVAVRMPVLRISELEAVCG